MSPRPTVGVFDTEDGTEYRLIIGGIVYDLTMLDDQLVGWYVYDRNTDTFLGGGGQ